MEILKILLNARSVINSYYDNDVKVRDHCFITEQYEGSAHRDCNINV